MLCREAIGSGQTAETLVVIQITLRVTQNDIYELGPWKQGGWRDSASLIQLGWEYNTSLQTRKEQNVAGIQAMSQTERNSKQIYLGSNAGVTI